MLRVAGAFRVLLNAYYYYGFKPFARRLEP